VKTAAKKIGEGERGNALFLILIAVALFAALSYATTQTGRGTTSVGKETDSLSAGQVTQYPALVRSTVQRMILTGVPVSGVTGIDFQSGVGENKVFDTTQGGGASIRKPPSGIGNAQGDGGPVNGWAAGYTNNSWGFVDLTPSGPPKGFYILGLGTDTVNTGRDAIMYLHDISLGVCQQIQRGLGLSTTLATQTVPVVWTTGNGQGSNGAHNLVAGTGDAITVAPSANAAGQAFSCYANGATNDYFHAIIEQ
jgi:hypothetical protein